MAALVAAQAEVAINAADAVLFVVDATVGITDADEAVVRVLRKSGKPVVLAANKVDDQRVESEAMNLWGLGIGEPFPISAMHGRGTGDMLDAVLAALPEAPPERDAATGGPRRIAIVGKPNVGKSSLLNKVAKEDRVVVSDIAGTTVDPVDELITLVGKEWRFIDTAGIRRKVKNVQGHEYYASLRTNAAIERAEVVVVVVDASLPMTEQDIRIMNAVEEAGKALVIAYNKWDLVDEDRRYYLEKEIDRDLVQFRWAPRVNISALTGRHMEKLVPAIEAALDGLADPRPDRPAERVPRPAGRGAPAPGAVRQAAEDPVRHPGDHDAADLRDLHLRGDRAVVPAVHRAAAARGLRLRRQSGACADPGPEEAEEELRPFDRSRTGGG